jgi:hypothetical protein
MGLSWLVGLRQWARRAAARWGAGCGGGREIRVTGGRLVVKLLRSLHPDAI